MIEDGIVQGGKAEALLPWVLYLWQVRLFGFPCRPVGSDPRAEPDLSLMRTVGRRSRPPPLPGLPSRLRRQGAFLRAGARGRTHRGGGRVEYFMSPRRLDGVDAAVALRR